MDHAEDDADAVDRADGIMEDVLDKVVLDTASESARDTGTTARHVLKTWANSRFELCQVKPLILFRYRYQINPAERQRLRLYGRK